MALPDSFPLRAHGGPCMILSMIERILRVARSFEEAATMDREDNARLSLEERVSAVDRLRRIWFGEDPAECGLVRVLVALDRRRSAVPPRGRTRRRRAR